MPTPLLLLALLPLADAKKPKKAPAAPPAVEVALPCNYAPGDVHRFHVEETTTDVRAGQPDDRMVVRRDYTFRIESWDGSVVTTLVSLSPAQLADPPDDPMVAAMMAEAAALTFEKPARVAYTHAVGQPQVLNLDEMVAMLAAQGDAMRPTIEANLVALDAEVAQGILAWYDGYVRNPVVVAKPFLELAQPVFAYSCIQIASGSYAYETQLPNAFGPDPLPAHGSLQVGAPDGGKVHYVDTTVLDPIGAMPILAPLFESMGMPILPGSGLEDLEIDMNHRIDLDVSVADGWPIGWVTEQRVSAAGTRKIIRTVVTRID